MTLEGSLRYLQDLVRQQVLNGLDRHLAGLAKATGAEIDLVHTPDLPRFANDPGLTEQAVGLLRRLLGSKSLQLLHPAMGSEDFSYFAAKVPGFYFFLGVRTPGRPGSGPALPHFNPDEKGLPFGLNAVAGLLAALAEEWRLGPSK